MFTNYPATGPCIVPPQICFQKQTKKTTLICYWTRCASICPVIKTEDHFIVRNCNAKVNGATNHVMVGEGSFNAFWRRKVIVTKKKIKQSPIFFLERGGEERNSERNSDRQFQCITPKICCKTNHSINIVVF